jgi:hypothetical protein
MPDEKGLAHSVLVLFGCIVTSVLGIAFVVYSAVSKRPVNTTIYFVVLFFNTEFALIFLLVYNYGNTLSMSCFFLTLLAFAAQSISFVNQNVR